MVQIFISYATLEWNLPRINRFLGGAMQETCIRAGGPLDEATWDQYAPGVSYQDTCAAG